MSLKPFKFPRLELRQWKAILSITVGAVTPFGLYFSGESTMKAAVAGSIIGMITAMYTWVDQTLTDQLAAREMALDRAITSTDINVDVSAPAVLSDGSISPFTQTVSPIQSGLAGPLRLKQVGAENPPIASITTASGPEPLLLSATPVSQSISQFEVPCEANKGTH